MPIVCKWATFGEQGQAEFSSVDDMFAHRMYNSFNFINMDSSGAIKMPPYLPLELQILSFNDNKIFNLPPLPSTLHSIYAKNNRLNTFPDISRCVCLEDINLNGNDIEILDCDIPPNVKTIDLCFNRLMYINYEKINTFVKIEASYCFLTVVPPQTHIRNVTFDHNDINSNKYNKVIPIPIEPLPTAPPQDGWEAYNINGNYAAAGVPDRIRTYLYRPLPTAPIQTKRIIGTDSQSVHQVSIQKTANESLDYILKYAPKKSLPEDLITEVINNYKLNTIKKSRMRRFIKGISKSWAESGINIPPIRKWCVGNDIHSQYGITYKALLKQVWAIIEDHEHREAMRDVLFQELDESVGVCFTGRFTRTLNALTGFIEQVKVGISLQEQMQNQIAMAVKNAREKLGSSDFQPEARANVKKILVEFEIPEAEHEIWLDAIE